MEMKKLSVAVQTGDWYDEEHPEESIRFIKDCGFEGIDYNINNVFSQTFDKEKLTSFFDRDVAELYAYYEPLKRACREYGVDISQMHALFPVYEPGREEKNAYYIAVIEKMMAVCRYLDCPGIVVHPWTGADMTKEEEREVNLGVYRKLIPTAKQYGVKIWLENLGSYDKRWLAGACGSPEDACWYIDTLNIEAGEELFGFCFDVGHAYITGQNIYQYLMTLGHRVQALHIHDNDGKEDQHLLPYSQKINWERFLKGLTDSGYDKALSFETFVGIARLPEETRKEGLCLVSAIGRYFRTRIKRGTAHT